MADTRVLILGVRGQTGREVAKQLVARGGVAVRGTARDAAGIDLDGVEPARFDWEQPDTWPGVLAGGVDAIYVVRPELEDAPERLTSFLGQAGISGPVVLLSEIAAETLPAHDWVARVERAVMDSTASWTILRPASFSQLLTDERYLLGPIRDAGEIAFPTGDGAIAFVDTRDIAAVAVEALLDQAHAGQAYTLTGPEAVSFGDVAARLTAAVGHDVRHVDPPQEDALREFAAAGLPPWFVEYLRGTTTRVQQGLYAQRSDAVEQVTGVPPRSLDGFVAEHAASWRR